MGRGYFFTPPFYFLFVYWRIMTFFTCLPNIKHLFFKYFFIIFRHLWRYQYKKNRLKKYYVNHSFFLPISMIPDWCETWWPEFYGKKYFGYFSGVYDIIKWRHRFIKITYYVIGSTITKYADRFSWFRKLMT